MAVKPLCEYGIDIYDSEYWKLASSDEYGYEKVQTMSHMVNNCHNTMLPGDGLQRLTLTKLSGWNKK